MSTEKLIEIERGADFEIPFKLTKSGVAEPLGLGAVPPDEITVLLPAANTATNSIVFKLSAAKVVVDSDPRGEFKVIGTETDSPLLKLGKQGQLDIVVKIKRGTEDIIKTLKSRIAVIEPSLKE